MYGSIVVTTELSSKKNCATTAQQFWQLSWRSQIQQNKAYRKQVYRAPPPALPHVELTTPTWIWELYHEIYELLIRRYLNNSSNSIT